MALQTNKVALCYPNYIDETTLSGGSWSTLLPLDNVKNRVLSKRARSTDLLPASTQFSMNFARSRSIGSFCIASHNFSIQAMIRVTAYSEPNNVGLLYDSGIMAVWPAVFSTQDLEWEFDNFWFGNIDEEERQKVTPLYTLFFEPVIVQSLKVEIFDETNMSGYVQLGRVFTSGIFQPDVNMSLGVQFSYENTTEVEIALDRTEYFDVRRQKRTISFVLEGLSEQEAFGRVYTMKRDLGVDGEVLVAYNLDQTSELFIQRTFLARNQSIDPIAHPFLSTYSSAINLVELL